MFNTIVDPNPSTEKIANRYNAKWFANHMDLINKIKPDGIIIAAPNSLHKAIICSFTRHPPSPS